MQRRGVQPRPLCLLVSTSSRVVIWTSSLLWRLPWTFSARSSAGHPFDDVEHWRMDPSDGAQGMCWIVLAPSTYQRGTFCSASCNTLLLRNYLIHALILAVSRRGRMAHAEWYATRMSTCSAASSCHEPGRRCDLNRQALPSFSPPGCDSFFLDSFPVVLCTESVPYV
jgi:hypothetical protein